MRFGLFQMDILRDFDQNFEKAKRAILEANKNDLKLLVFPETFISGYYKSSIKKVSDRLSYYFDQLCFMSREYKIDIYGTFPLKENANIYNCGFYFSEGSCIARYKKIHLIEVMGEKDIFSEGKEAVVAESNLIGRVGLAICYDLRFPELFRKVSINSKVTIVSAMWPKTRIEHWKTLLRARSIENQCFVIGVNRVGSDKNNLYPGNSLIFDPYGTPILECDNLEGLYFCDVDLSVVERFRKDFNVLADRRIFSL
ncbi:nitrilase-related carbon-nitrogen hydrolase [Thermodesulfobium acidiphilum]|nr:nitrilase-related carbon-nitrogen hydrolase [Thermodesulfobium acidiphilum]